jgi:hypothetical protein
VWQQWHRKEDNKEATQTEAEAIPGSVVNEYGNKRRRATGKKLQRLERQRRDHSPS